jgi:hypothetical protein
MMMNGAKVEVTLVEGSHWPLNMRIRSSFEDNSATVTLTKYLTTVALTKKEASKLITVLLMALTEGKPGEVEFPDGPADMVE